MAKGVRKAISKKTRFEVFKRDSFTCQYCGKAAPSVVLHLDHIQPVSKGGDNSILNLVTACAACNGGKSDRALDDQSVLAKQRDQLAALNERREQLEMMVQWREHLLANGEIEFGMLVAEFDSRIGTQCLNEHGKALLRPALRKHGLEVALKAVAASCDRFLDWTEGGASPTSASITQALRKIDQCALYAKLPPAGQAALYCRGILKRRFPEDVYPGSYAWTDFMSMCAEAFALGLDEDRLKDACKAATNYDELDLELTGWIHRHQPEPTDA